MAFGEVRVAEWQKAGLLKPSVIKPILTTVKGDSSLRSLVGWKNKIEKAFETLFKPFLAEC